MRSTCVSDKVLESGVSVTELFSQSGMNSYSASVQNVLTIMFYLHCLDGANLRVAFKTKTG